MIRLALLAPLLLLTPAGSQEGGLAPAEPSRFGADTPAGRGGRVLRVTALAPEGPGSLREAIAASGARIVVFEVGGVIDLGGRALVVREPWLGLAGQTAPSPGITILRGGLRIETHDVLVQHLRVRPGDAGRAKRSGWEPDGISTSGGDAHDVVIDHCSITWAVDENLSASGPRDRGPEATSHRITFRSCIVAEGLHDSSHSKGPHSKGSLIHDWCREIAVIGNLYAHNADRNPYFKAYTTGVVVNNVIYDPGGAAIRVDYWDPEWEGAKARPEHGRIAVVGNLLLHGPSTRAGSPLVGGRGRAWLEDNLAFDRAGEAVALVSERTGILEERPIWPEGLEALPADEVLEQVLSCAGARPRERDEVDARIVRQVRERTGRVIDSQEEVGGYPSPEATRRALEIPEGDVEAWLAELALALESDRPAPRIPK